MPQVYELDEAEFARYQALKQNAPVVAMVEQIMGNPNARKKLLEARKAVDPNAAIPELDAAKPIEEAVSGIREEFATIRKELADEKAEREKERSLATLNANWSKGQAKLRAAGYTEDGIKAIEKLMEEQGIANHEAAAAYYDRLNPPAEPVAPTSTRMDIFAAPAKDDVMKMLHEGDEDGFLNTQIAAIRAESRTAR